MDATTLRHCPVVPAKALGIHKRLELRALGDVLIGRFQHPIHGPLPQALAFGFIGHPEVAGQSRKKAYPATGPCRRRDRGDFCQIQPFDRRDANAGFLDLQPAPP
ncbi:MAG: hypothetical protein ACLU9S_06180 [Oscillospiraceae bacterium]